MNRSGFSKLFQSARTSSCLRVTCAAGEARRLATIPEFQQLNVSLVRRSLGGRGTLNIMLVTRHVSLATYEISFPFISTPQELNVSTERFARMLNAWDVAMLYVL
jgi:hypothetical protein